MHPQGWKRHAVEAVVLLLAIAYGARLVWSWLMPLMPGVTVVAMLLVVYAVLFRRWRR